jgi:hypothetical protein
MCPIIHFENILKVYLKIYLDHVVISYHIKKYLLKYLRNELPKLINCIMFSLSISKRQV